MDEAEHPGMPTWIKTLIGVAVLAVVVMAALHLMGGAPTGH